MTYSLLQCLHHIRIFLDHVVLKVEENTEAILNFQESVTGGSYEQIIWYKNQTGDSAYRIAWLHPFATGGEPLYYNEFCSGSSSCETSSRVQLHVDSGELVLHSVTISDAGFYYYYFYLDGGTPGTGHKYEIELEVCGKVTKFY